MQIYRFGPFELDLEAQQLRRQGEAVHLERRPFKLLVLLVAQPGRMIAREDIVAALWPEKVIIDFEAGLNTLVRKVRQALGDSAETPDFIETVPGRGYRFIATVAVINEPRAPAPAPAPAPAWTAGLLRPLPLAATALAVLLALAAIITYWPFSTSLPVRIAVLPFENLTGDDELDYLAAGLAEETGNSLAQIDLRNLRLIGGVSSRAAAESILPVKRMGAELGVDFVVRSSLRRAGTKIRVTSQLIRVTDSEQIWSGSFNRELTDILGLQRELSIALAEQVRQRLSPEVSAAIDRRQTPNPAAYALYLKGRLLWSKLSPFAVREALAHFEQAAQEDPGYALAWAGISHVSSTSLMIADAIPAIAEARARHALRRALELDPDLAEVQYAKGYVHLFIDWDMPAAETAARRAIELDPNNAMAHMLLGMALATMDQFVEARAVLRRARELDPFFALTFANSANAELMSGDPDAALEFSRQAIAIDPENWVAYFHLGNALSRLGEIDAAMVAYSDAARYSGGNSKTLSARAVLLVQAGREREAREILAQMTAHAETQYVPPYALAIIHAALGPPDPALNALERAVDVQDLHAKMMKTDSRLQMLQAEPRFGALVRRASVGAQATGASGL